MLVDVSGRPLTRLDFYLEEANKAVIGPGANVYANGGTPLTGMTSKRVMEAAQFAYSKNPWIRTAEGLISKKLSTMDWHLEIHTEADDEEKPVTSGPAFEFLDIGSPLQKLTRSKLWQITSRHMGICNNAFWYPDTKQRENGNIYINPARMTPVPDARGYLDFWVVDADERGENGVRFEKDEILWFQLEAADSGFFGHGLVYTAMLKATLSTAADSHALQVLEAGGRLQGILTPTKDEYLADSQFFAMQREMRNVTELDDSAKRMVLLRKAVQFTPTTMKPQELELATLMRMSKEDIYEIWGVPRSQTGGMTEVGMNSGDRQSYEEAALMQNAVHPRIVVFEEIVREVLRIFDPRLELEIAEPEFDDERPLYEMLKMSEFAPMSNDERRRLIKLPPLKNKTIGQIVSQNPSLLQIDPPMPIARSMITGRLQDGSTVEPAGTPKAVEPHLDAINKARGATFNQSSVKADIDTDALSDAIASRIIEKADHFLARPTDFDVIASQKLVAGVVGDKALASDLLREIHAGLKAIVDRGRANDWAVEEYAEAVRQATLVSDEPALTPPETSPPPFVANPGLDMTPVAQAMQELGEKLRQAPTALRRFVPERDNDGRIVAIQETLA